MSGGIVIVIVLGLIFLARKKMGDNAYDSIVVKGFKWLIILNIVGWGGLYIYGYVVR